MQTRATIFLIGENDSFCHTVVALASQMQLSVVRFPTGPDFLRHYDGSQTGCVIIDFDKPQYEGLHVVDQLMQMTPYPPVIGIVGQVDVSSVVAAARHGVMSFLHVQNASGSEILDVIQAAISQDAQKREEIARRADITKRFATLSPVERQVVELLLRGDELLTIATKLNVSRKTIENRRERVMQKLGVNTLTELISISMEHDTPA